MTALKSYVNGNAQVTIYSDGTKVRETVEESFNLKWPETIDINTSDRCAHGCPECYISATPKKRHGDMAILFERMQVRPGMELALNLNSEIPPDLTIENLLGLPAIVNVTTNSFDIGRHFAFLAEAQERGAIRGVGVSVSDFEALGPELALENVVYHAINGIQTADDLIARLPSGARLLILGYKHMKGRGRIFKPGAYLTPRDVERLFEHFAVVSFDNLALDQIDVRSVVGDDAWARHYMGDDGTASMFIDLVSGKFALSSTARVTHPLPPGRIVISEIFATAKQGGSK